MERLDYRTSKVDKLREIIFQGGSEGMSFYDAAQKAAYHRSNFTAFLEGRDDDVAPVSIEVVPSLECNFHCPDCTYIQNMSKGKLGSKRLMSPRTFNRITDQASGIGIRSVVFTGGGEPFVHPETPEFVKKAIDRGYEVGIYTNGFNLSSELSARIIGLNPTFVRVSLNAGDALTHSIMFGYSGQSEETINRTFTRVTGNIEALGREKIKQGADTTVGIGFIVGTKNYDGLSLIAPRLREIYTEANGGIDYAAFRPEVKYFDENLTPPVTQPAADIFMSANGSIEAEVVQKLSDLGVQIIVGHDGFTTLSQPFEPEQNIAATWSASFDFDGSLYVSSEHNGSPGYDAGNINERDLLSIWLSEERKSLTRNLMALPYFKLKTLNDTLLRIRELGAFTPEEVRLFYEENTMRSNLPMHANFI